MKTRTIKFTYEGKDYEETFAVTGDDFGTFFKDYAFVIDYSTKDNQICVYEYYPNLDGTFDIYRQNLIYSEKIKDL
ncbi:MAG: hypothetical protein LBE36_13495 [Flavobacteriaceae bacterium]|jgi:hypothetical protein|nr:hypothetical protein [Flavobacteriaceae bacterium]